MSNVAKVVLGSSCLFSVTVIGYVHYQQAADREQLHQGVLRDIERQQRKSENVSILQKQQQLTKQLKEASGISSEIT
ncbi:hypothetical protein WA026_008549 [Henosepilachna vigintioctopunctata]|uniref:Protein PET117 homolog, mitochondrial n=1 Tax=Henosepilachna vigintioctopunctata TaxID=420089 RepID=A0AAW1UFT8_9CUCU